MIELAFNYNPLLFSKGVPQRLQHARSFELRGALKQITLEKGILNAKRQAQFLDSAANNETGWLMYLCSAGYLDKAKHLAANVCQAYLERDLEFVWLTSFDRLDRAPFFKYKLVVIDALFADASPHRRDRVYEVITHYCNIPDLSVLVLGQHASPTDMAQQLGMQPNFMIQAK